MAGGAPGGAAHVRLGGGVSKRRPIMAGRRANVWFQHDAKFRPWRRPDRPGRLVDSAVQRIDHEAAAYGPPSLSRSRVARVYNKTGNLRACQLLLGHRNSDVMAGRRQAYTSDKSRDAVACNFTMSTRVCAASSDVGYDE